MSHFAGQLSAGQGAAKTGHGRHFVQFFENDEVLADTVSRFVASGLTEGAGAIIVATEEHASAIEARLVRRGLDVGRITRSGQLVFLDAARTLASLMDGGLLRRERFDKVIGGVVRGMTAAYPVVHAYGEMVGLLWRKGDAEGTLALEHLWNELLATEDFALLCGYPLDAFAGERHAQGLRDICGTHSHVLPGDFRSVALLKEQALALQFQQERRRRVEGDLRESEALKFRLLVEGVKDYAIFMLDPEGNVASWNEGAKRFKGYEAREILGRHFSTFYPEHEKASKPAMELEVASRTGRFEDEGWRIRKDGSRFWANVIITAMRDEEGVLVGFSKVTRDLTEKKRAEDELREARARFESQARTFDAALSSSPDFYYIFDAQRRFTYANRSLLKFWGKSLEEVLGKTLGDLGYMPELVELHEGQMSEVLRGKSVRGEVPHVAPSGKTTHYEYVFSPVFDERGEVQAISGTARDVTERIQVERERLERQRLEEAQRAIRVRDEFMSIASHELKTPLTSLKLQAQMRERDLRRGDLRRFSAEKLPGLVGEDARQIDRLIRLVDDMLDVSRIQTGKLSLSYEEFDLCGMVRDTLERLGGQIEAGGCEVAVEADGAVIGNWDRFRLEQVVINLLTNALKYGAGKPIGVRVAGDPDRARIAISDRGIGIAPEDQKRIFGQFERAVSAGSFGGLGVGLYISKRIVEAHGGAIAVESAIGEGSTFVVDIPRRGAGA